MVVYRGIYQEGLFKGCQGSVYTSKFLDDLLPIYGKKCRGVGSLRQRLKGGDWNWGCGGKYESRMSKIARKKLGKNFKNKFRF